MLSKDKPKLPLDACYVLTLNTVDKIDVFVRPAYKQVIADALNYFIDAQGLTVYCWCLMSSHLHLVVRTKDGTAPAYFEKDFKKFTTPAILKTIEMEMDFRREWMMQHFEEYPKSLRRLEKFNLWQNCSSPLRIVPGQETNQNVGIERDAQRPRAASMVSCISASETRRCLPRRTYLLSWTKTGWK